MKKTKSRREAWIGLALISPWIVGFLVFMAYPLLFSLYMSFNKVMITPTGIETRYLGWSNYKDAFLVDAEFSQQLFLFLKSNLLMIPIVIVFSLFVALLINQPIRGRNLFRAIFFLPVVITSGEVVQELFAQGAATIPVIEKYGLVAMIEDNLSPGLAVPIIGIINQFILILWYSGVQILIFLAGLQKVNTQVYEAAAMDGASPWVTFWKITLPEVKPFILVNLIYTVIDLFTNGFSEVIKLIQDNMFKAGTGFGYASALAWIYFAVIFIVLLLFVLFFRSKETSIRHARRS
ncbi:carbohydrate ABC transporter permease [Paenibacillus sp. B01]|uniref:carbohydrate ABC transporter permease n=1 Tax=Paenibacillus sp. B01 TaxID=2660554 RepID=UPI00129ABD3C|nr:sugar ABC transporter permease [Paenibacillus sp. B01]QGG57044.1 ABC transporter permease subunit [Paenibacillus sp. B01]